MANAAHAALFTWEKPHNTYIKGFGNVVAYFVYSSKDHPPKELLGILALDISVDDYYFDKVRDYTMVFFVV